MQPTAEQLTQNQNFERLDREQRVRTDTVTWMAETLNGSMRTSFEYRFDGRELYGEDGGNVRKVFTDGITAAHAIAEQSPNLLFELRRRLIEWGEYEDILRMAKGELPNTMIVVSDFPPELMDSPEDIGGYNASRQQTMLRVIMRQADGSIRFVTQTLDGSNRQALEELYGYMDEPVEAGELLGQRVRRELSVVQQARLIDDLTSVYDASLGEQFGGEWHAGRKQEAGRGIINTYEFAAAQEDLVVWFSQLKLEDSLGAEKMRFRLAAEARSRFLADQAQAFITYRPATILQDEQALHAFHARMDQSARSAVSLGLTFSGCGASVDGSLTESQLEQAGYGNRTSETTTYSFNKIMYCNECQKPPKKGETKKACGPCGFCRPCDKKLGGKG